MRFFRGAWSILRKIVEVDVRVVGYILFGPNPPRVIFLTIAIALASLTVALVRNPTGGTVLAIFSLIVFGFALYLIANAPPLRWHILSDSIRMVFDEPALERVWVTDTLNLRSMRRTCASLLYPIGQLMGDFRVLEVSQDGQALPEKAAGDGQPGYVVESIGQAEGRVTIDFDRKVGFGQSTVIVIRWEARGPGTSRTDRYGFSANTFVDHLSITVCFHRTAYPRKITASSTFGILEEPQEFHAQRRAEDADHICETWAPLTVTYLHQYSLRWSW